MEDPREHISRKMDEWIGAQDREDAIAWLEEVAADISCKIDGIRDDMANEDE